MVQVYFPEFPERPEIADSLIKEAVERFKKKIPQKDNSKILFDLSWYINDPIEMDIAVSLLINGEKIYTKIITTKLLYGVQADEKLEYLTNAMVDAGRSMILDWYVSHFTGEFAIFLDENFG